MKQKKLTCTICAALILQFTGGSLKAASFSDPSWPCIQRKVEKLSMGIMWPHPIPQATNNEKLEPDAKELATKLALRRFSVKQTEPLVAEFMAKHPKTDVILLGRIFKQVFDKLSSNRNKIMRGIKKYSHKQIALSKSIETTRGDMAVLMKAEKPDFDKVDKLEEKLDWDERIFRDRSKSLTYVCETPVLLEKRIYAIAQILLRHVQQ